MGCCQSSNTVFENDGHKVEGNEISMLEGRFDQNGLYLDINKKVMAGKCLSLGLITKSTLQTFLTSSSIFASRP